MDLDKYPDFMKDPNIVLQDEATWQEDSPPDYSLVNELYEREKSKDHEPGTLEYLINNLIKNWEREGSHKTDVTQWRTMDAEKFRIAVNGIWHSGEELAIQGNYNLLIGENEFYSAKRVGSNEESHKLFRGLFKDGFAWELLEVISAPPRVGFKWRHWGRTAGGMKCPMRNGSDWVVEPSEKDLEIFGFSIVSLDEKYRIVEMENFWNPDQLMQQIASK